jgi:hypothetical protein
LKILEYGYKKDTVKIVNAGIDHGEAMTWSRSDHLTCGRSPHHGGFAAMTSELRSDHGETMTWSLCDHLTIVVIGARTTVALHHHYYNQQIECMISDQSIKL